MGASTDLLTDEIVKGLPRPKSGYSIAWDKKIKGFGVRITTAGARSFVLNYRTRGGRPRRYTIGSFPDWKTVAARNEAIELKKQVDRGEDPMGDLAAHRAAPTVADLCTRFIEEHLPRKRESTRKSYQSLIDKEILPTLRPLKVTEVSFSDVDGLHRKISKRAPYRANRVAAVLSKMFALAIKWQWATENPVRGIERNDEPKRRRYLSGEELERLFVALTSFQDQAAANIVRLLLLTGARSGEVRGARWDQFDLTEGVWTKPAALTKIRAEHRVPLSAPARLLLSQIRKDAPADGHFVFPGRENGHRGDIKDAWASICRVAELKGARVHDLRHTSASLLVSAGYSLPVIGALLGHTQPATTARYAHLLDAPQRAAADRLGSILADGRHPEMTRG